MALGLLSKQVASCLWCTSLGQLCGCLYPTSLVALGGPEPATAQGGGYRTGHIKVSLLPLTAEQWKPLNPEEKKRYDREFLLGFQFIFASMQKPEGLPQITDVVLDKVGAALEIGVVWVVPRWGSGSSFCLVKASQRLTCCARGLVAASATSLEPGVGVWGHLWGLLSSSLSRR